MSRCYQRQLTDARDEALAFLAALPGRLRWLRNVKIHVLEIDGQCFRVAESDLLEAIQVFRLARRLGLAVESFQFVAIEARNGGNRG